jgi:hypothetical protein
MAPQDYLFIIRYHVKADAEDGKENSRRNLGEDAQILLQFNSKSAGLTSNYDIPLNCVIGD